MSQNVLESFRREEQEGLMVGKGARPPGEREEEWAAFSGMGPGKRVLEGARSATLATCILKEGLHWGRARGDWKSIKRRKCLLEGQVGVYGGDSASTRPL